MANKTRTHLLTLTHPQLVALATQKEVLFYQDALILTKGQLIAIMVDIEGILTPTEALATTPMICEAESYEEWKARQKKMTEATP